LLETGRDLALAAHRHLKQCNALAKPSARQIVSTAVVFWEAQKAKQPQAAKSNGRKKSPK